MARNVAQRITPEAIAAWTAGDWMELHRALRLRPWETSSLDAVGDCDSGGMGAKTWQAAASLREALSALAA